MCILRWKNTTQQVWPVYDEDGISGIDISDTGLLESLDNKDNDKLIVVFPVEGSHHEACQKFLEFILKN